MNTFLGLLLFYSISLECVHSLECHVSDFASLEAGNLDVRPAIRNCDAFLQDISKTKSDSDLPSNAEDDLRCFTVRIESEKANIAIRGCTPEQGCDKMINELLLKDWIHRETVTCRECSGNLCNAEDVKVVRSTVHAASERRTYLILTVVMIIVFMAVISIMLRIFSRRYAQSEKKYSQIRV